MGPSRLALFSIREEEIVNIKDALVKHHIEHSTIEEWDRRLLPLVLSSSSLASEPF